MSARSLRMIYDRANHHRKIYHNQNLACTLTKAVRKFWRWIHAVEQRLWRRRLGIAWRFHRGCHQMYKVNTIYSGGGNDTPQGFSHTNCGQILIKCWETMRPYTNRKTHSHLAGPYQLTSPLSKLMMKHQLMEILR